MNKVYEIIRKNFDTRCENMVLTYIMSKGIELCKAISEEDIASLKGNGLMTDDFVKAIVRTSNIVAKECSQEEIIEFILERCDRRAITYDRMSEIASAAIQNLDELDKEYFISDCYLEENEAEYFGITLEEEDEEYE